MILLGRLLLRPATVLRIRCCSLWNNSGGIKLRTVPKLKIGAGIVGFAVAKSTCNNFWVRCDVALQSRIERVDAPDVKFNWYRFWSLVVQNLGHFLAAVVCALVVAVLNIQIPRLLGDIVNVIAEHPEEFFEAVKQPALRLAAMYAAQSVFTFGYIYTLSCAGERMASKLRQDLFHSLLNQDVEFFDLHRTGDLVTRLTADVQDFKSAFKTVISQGLRSVTQATGSFIALYFISPQLTGAMLVILPSVLLTGTVLGSTLRHLSREAQAQVSRATAVCEEAISNLRTVRAFAMEDAELKMYSDEVEESRRISEKLGFGIGLFQGGANLFLNGVVLGTLCFGGHLVSSKDVNAGQLMSFLVASQMIQRSLGQVFLLFGHFVRGISAGGRVFEFLDKHPTIQPHQGKIIPQVSLHGEIKFNKVTFSYPTRPNNMILKKFSLWIKPGKSVAIVGSSGAGKSTLAALLERFYDAPSGSITIDGYAIQELDPSWLRGKAIGYINQEPILFATTIMENIRYGRPGATDDECIEAAKSANADEFIRSFSRGYETVVGERGQSVSGGQKQRIAIARALLKDPVILILDEATSALDAASEHVVQEALEKCSKGRTVMVIAHRLSTVEHADNIAVLHKGTIVEQGTHEELKKKKGLYWNLFRQQQHQQSAEEKFGSAEES